ncbi:hypothetical protein RJ639_008304 [Escallonia herrerae]|uniref:Pentatricopeptide repeat-containing protein n=1 Tax=Escallonia herrerae TaxID=1293975 RepID=A0AA88VVG1_9ASTE|nr:hypothetical protein RJ639_008304 [Escallonia herrerae]
MAVGLKTTARRSSLSLEKFIKAQKNLSKPTSKLWPGHHHHDDNNHRHQPPDVGDAQGVRTLTLAHPLMRTLDAAAATPKQFNQVHAQLAISGLFHHPLAAGRAVKRLCSTPSTVSHAVKLFNCLEEPDAFICNTIMRALINMNDPNGAMNFYYHQMVAKFVTPNHYTFPLLFKMFDELASGGGGDKVHTLVLKHGFELDLFVKNALIHFYFVSGRILNARKVFGESPESDLVMWNTMIDGYVKNGEKFYLLYWISIMPRANKDAAASLVCAIRPKARLLRMKSVRSLDP